MARSQRPRKKPVASATIGRPRKLTHEAIVSAAAQVMAGEGFAALSLRSLAAKLGVSHPTLYNYVEHIEDVEAEVLQSLAAKLPMPTATDAAGIRRELLELMHALRALLLKHPRMIMPALGSSAWTTFSGVTVHWMQALGRHERDLLAARAAFNALVSVTAIDAERERIYGPNPDGPVEKLARKTFGDLTPPRPSFAQTLELIAGRMLPGLAK